MYKQAVAYARFASLGEDEHKVRMESGIRESLSAISEQDRHLIEEWIWRENAEPLTLDPEWGRTNVFHSPMALYSAVNKAIHMKLLTLSPEDRASVLSRCEGETSNICKLADSFM